MKSSSLPHPGYAPKFPDNFCIIFSSVSSMKTISLYHWKHIFAFDCGIGQGLSSEPTTQQGMGVYYNPISVHANMFNTNISKQWKDPPADITRTEHWMLNKVLPRALQTYVGSCDIDLICHNSLKKFIALKTNGFMSSC